MRAIPYVSGWTISPDVVAKNFARDEAAPFEKLENTDTYHLVDGWPVKLLPKEWDRYVAALQGLEAELREQLLTLLGRLAQRHGRLQRPHGRSEHHDTEPHRRHRLIHRRWSGSRDAVPHPFAVWRLQPGGPRRRGRSAAGWTASGSSTRT